MNKALKDIVQGRLTELDRNPFDAARKGGLERSYVNDILIGKKKSVRGDKLEQLAAALDLRVADLVAASAPAKGALVAVAGLVSAGSEMTLYSEGQGSIGNVRAPSNATPTTAAAEIRGTSLGDLFNGWILFFDDRREGDATDRIGKACVVGLADGRVMVKRVERGQLPGRFTLRSVTEPPIYDAEVIWTALVTGMEPR